MPWEPQRAASQPDLTRDAAAFAARCTARDRDRTADSAYAFGLFVDQRFAGEVNLNNIVRGALQSGTVGYWIDRGRAGQGYVAEGVVVLARFAFEQLHLHRLEVCIVPRNTNSRRVMEKLGLRCEGLSEQLPGDRGRVGGPPPLRHHRRGLGRRDATSSPARGSEPIPVRSR